jgi:hypothetical protein
MKAHIDIKDSSAAAFGGAKKRSSDEVPNDMDVEMEVDDA